MNLPLRILQENEQMYAIIASKWGGAGWCIEVKLLNTDTHSTSRSDILNKKIPIQVARSYGIKQSDNSKEKHLKFVIVTFFRSSMK
jgi:hypothetical protein